MLFRRGRRSRSRPMCSIRTSASSGMARKPSSRSIPSPMQGMARLPARHVATDAIPGNQAQQNQRDASKPASGSLTITSAAQRTEDLVFPILVTPATTSISIDGKSIPLSAGMTVTVEVKTESRRAIDYLLSPLIDIQSTAMRER
jgi:hemolysin D